MSYDTVVEKVKTLPESCLEDVSKYLDFLHYQYEQTKMTPLVESDEEFNASMQQGFDDMKAGRVTTLKEAFAEIETQAYTLHTAEEIWIM